VILSANPIHDTGGGQRSAQLAFELLDRGVDVLFVSHGKVTETVDLNMRFDHPRLRSMGLADALSDEGAAVVDRYLCQEPSLVITQVPIRDWEPVLARARAAGAVTVYDCIDRWDSELGRGWFRAEAERRIAIASDVLVASATELVDHVEHLSGRETALLPNAYNSRIFRDGTAPERPADLPHSGHIALYVGALWGGWLDWGLVDRAARSLPETTFVFVGDHRREGRGLPTNCVFLGLKPQTSLPGYLACADVAFLPWRADEVTQATSPLKVYEFVAMGLPVVGPSIETLNGIPGVRQFTDADDFIAAVGETTRSALLPETVRSMKEFSEQNSWVQRVDALLELTCGAAPEDDSGRGHGAPAAQPKAMISVVVPSHNHERWICQAIESVRAQSLPAGEVVVVEDGSTDRSLQVLEECRFPGMRLVSQKNRGAPSAINRAVALSKGDYVAILNSDDEFMPERLEHAWGIARTTGAALLMGRVQFIDAEGLPLPDDHEVVRWYGETYALRVEGGTLARAMRKHQFAVTTSNFFFHRELWRRLGGFAPYRYVHDFDFIRRALELCADRVLYVEELDGVRYRTHDMNTIHEDPRRVREERAVMFARLRSPRRVARAFVGRGLARRAVARAVDQAPLLTPPSRTRRAARLRVGLVVPSLDHGGLEEVVALLAQTLPAQGAEPCVLCTHSGGAVANRLGQAGVRVTVARGRAQDWQEWRDQVRPDVLSTHFVGLEVLEALCRDGLPAWETLHNTYAWFEPSDWERERRKHALLTGTIAVSEAVANYYARHTGTEVTASVIPNGVHPARAASVPRVWARSWLGLPTDAPVLAHLGRVTLQKNILGLLRAFEKLLTKEPGARLVLAGSFSDRAYVRKVRRAHRDVIRSGSVIMLPPVSHVGTVLSAADAYVSNSFFEGWNLAASEAAWNGLPLVLSECGSARSLVGDDEARGRMVCGPLGDPMEVTWDRLKAPSAATLASNEEALAGAMADVVREREEWAGKREMIEEWARRELSPERVARSYVEHFMMVSGS